MCPSWFKDEGSIDDNAGGLQKQQGKNERSSTSEVKSVVLTRMSLEARYDGTCLDPSA